MAERWFNTDGGTLYKRVRRLYPIVSVAGAGAVTLKKINWNQPGSVGVGTSNSLIDAPTTGVDYDVGDGAGVRTVARTGAGAWTITLSDPYQRLLGARVIQISNATGANASGLGCGVVSGTTNVTTNTARGNGGVVAVVLSSAASTATDPANGDTVTLELTLLDATEP